MGESENGEKESVISVKVDSEFGDLEPVQEEQSETMNDLEGWRQNDGLEETKTGEAAIAILGCVGM